MSEYAELVKRLRAEAACDYCPAKGGDFSRACADAIERLEAALAQKDAEIAMLRDHSTYKRFSRTLTRAEKAEAALAQAQSELITRKAVTIIEAEKEIDRLMEELAQAQQDARRYRWLRSESKYVAEFLSKAERDGSMTLELMDSALDAAMIAAAEREGK